MIDRLKGFNAALEARGLKLDPALVRHTAVTMEGGGYAARLLLSGPAATRPQAIFALSDIMAIGLLHGAHELGLSIPGDVSVVGYDDIELARYTFPPLTTVRQPAAEIGAAAARAIMDHLDGDVPLPHAVALQPELIVRQSVGML